MDLMMPASSTPCIEERPISTVRAAEHAIGLSRALAAYLARGYRGIVSYVEWNDFSSLKSCDRMGYRDCGDIAVAGVGAHYVLHHDAGGRQCGFRLQRASNRRY